MEKTTKVKTLFFITLSFLLISCETSPEIASTTNKSTLSETQNKLIRGANWIKGKKSLIVREKKFNNDCSGTIMAVYYYADIDLSKDFNKYTGNGVSRINQYLKSEDYIYYTKNPVPGDLIFWDNTYDSNGDGIRNDFLTHIGMVVSISDDGTITYLHQHCEEGIVFELMNLNDPDNREKNAGMRMKGTGKEGGWLSSHLYRESGMGYKLNDQ